MLLLQIPGSCCGDEHYFCSQVACGGCNTMAVVEHDAKANLKNYDIVTKELDDLLPRKMAPPAGLLIGGNALQNSYQSPAEQASGSGERSCLGRSTGLGKDACDGVCV